ncbi:MAG: (Fe-S)-binding protein [Promethearchaeota archaeon]
MQEVKEIPAELSKKLTKVNEMASFCYSCGKCLVVCPTNLLGIFSPKNFIHNLVTDGQKDIDGFIKDNNIFNCLTCEQCSIYCPMSTGFGGDGVIIAEIVQSLREYGFKYGLIDNELAQTQTHDGIMQLYPSIQSDSVEKTNNIDYIINDHSLKITENGEVAYFIGCASVMEDIFYNFDIKYKDIPRGVISILNEGGIIPVVLEEKSSGHDNYWIGDVGTAKKLAEYNIEIYKNAGVKTIVVEDAEAFHMWKFIYPKLVDKFDFKIKHFTEFIEEKNLLKIIETDFPESPKITYHDPCRLGRLGGKVYDPPRNVLKSVPQVELIEMKNIRDDSNCCGVATFKGCNSDTKQLRENRINEALETGAEYLITTCPKCITHFTCFLSETDDDGNEKPEKSKLKVMDLAAFIAKFTRKIS